ncbi:IS66 family insertion sequence element accessory protein TnpB [Levilactobacillus lanxiensis]
MLIDPSKINQVYIVCGRTDLRRGIDGLASVVQEQFELDPYNQALYLFCGTRRIVPRHFTGTVTDFSSG